MEEKESLNNDKNFWKINHLADINGTSLKLRIKAPSGLIHKVFSRPTWENRIEDLISEKEKSLALWAFTNLDGSVCTLYDWKGSSLYNDWHIGAHEDTAAHLFEIWLSNFLHKQNQESNQEKENN